MIKKYNTTVPVFAEEKECFVISPIGSDDSEIRDHADKFFDYIAKSIEEIGYNVERADKIQHSGQITDLIVKSIYNADLIIADLTSNNPNVYYELALAHSLKKNTILFKSDDTPIPFDNMNMITTHYDYDFEFGSIEKTKKTLFEKIENNDYSNPIISGLNRLKIDLDLDFRKNSENNSVTENMLYEILNRIDKLEKSINYEQKYNSNETKNEELAILKEYTRMLNDIDKNIFELTLNKKNLINMRNNETDQTKIKTLEENIVLLESEIEKYKDYSTKIKKEKNLF